MSMLVVRSGMLDTVQDTGRYGYGKWGINPGGAMDRYAAQVANALVGNGLDEAIVEFHFPASHLLFQKDTLITLTGADFTPCLNSTEVPLWKPILVRKNAVLSFRNKRQGTRCYLAVHGGLNISPWLESFSTNIKISAGGLNGKALKKGDVVSFRPIRYALPVPAHDFELLPWSVNTNAVYTAPDTIFFLEGNEWCWLTDASCQRMLSQEFRIDPSSDRMACYLQHEPLSILLKHELLSSAVSFGTIQALPNGCLVVLMADHQTTGGYPRVGHVITSHLPKLSQRGVNDVLRFQKISTAAAEKMLFSLQQELRMIHHACREKLDHYYAQH